MASTTVRQQQNYLTETNRKNQLQLRHPKNPEPLTLKPHEAARRMAPAVVFGSVSGIAAFVYFNTGRVKPTSAKKAQSVYAFPT